MRAVLGLLVAGASVSSLAACYSSAMAQMVSVNPPCAEPDAMTRLIEAQLQHLLTESDSDAVAFRTLTSLPTVSGSAALVNDASTCTTARAAYDRERSLLDPTYVADTTATRRVVVVQIGNLAAVLDRDPRLRKSEYHTLFVFNSSFSELKSYFAY